MLRVFRRYGVLRIVVMVKFLTIYLNVRAFPKFLALETADYVRRIEIFVVVVVVARVGCDVFLLRSIADETRERDVGGGSVPGYLSVF